MRRLTIKLRGHTRNNVSRSCSESGTLNAKAAAMSGYRSKIKQDPEKWMEHKVSEAKRLREYRLLMSEEKVQENREKSRQRMQQYRERKKKKNRRHC